MVLQSLSLILCKILWRSRNVGKMNNPLQILQDVAPILYSLEQGTEILHLLSDSTYLTYLTENTI